MDEPSGEKINKLIQEILKNGSVIPSNHARGRMSGRNYSLRDVMYILRNGILTETTLHKKQYRHTFCGKNLEGYQGEVVVELRENTREIIIITVKGGVK